MTLIIALYVACELIANVTASKPVSLGPIVVPSAVFIYTLTFTLIDLINERLGKRRARQVIYSTLAANVLLALYCKFAISLPAASFYSGQEAFASVLGSTPRIVAASLVAYLVSSLLDTHIFAWWKQRVGKARWLRVLVSNSVSTGVDSVVFITLAFYGTMPLLALMTGQYLVKMAVTVVSLPLIYLVRSRRADSSGRDQNWNG
ncbi:MAG: hypothetical protein AMJ46_01230 [Latescibacteria bacterium DG_63]|nr:MAG: hypothetical protein AMJ46_01230 [Latescibacteria bacterium DG_63]